MSLPRKRESRKHNAMLDSRLPACLRILKHLVYHHSNGSWNPEKSFIFQALLDSCLRRNDSYIYGYA